MIARATVYGLAIIALTLLRAPESVAQDSTKQALPAADGAGASGTFAPAGPPLAPPVRVEAAGSCIVDIKQAYVISGTLSGSLEIDYRIIVFGPCQVPPVLGKYNEQWIAHGTFSGAINGSAASGSLHYTAQVRVGGDVEGRMVLGGGVNGDMVVSGNFGDGQLSYSGWAK